MADVFPQRRVSELQPGPAQVTGQVMPAEPLLRAPVSGRSCVYYQVIGRNHSWPWHDRRSYPPADVGFWIDDGGGQLWIVVPPSAPSPGSKETEETIQCSIAGDVVRRTIYAGESPETDRLLDPGGFPFRPDAYLNVEERIVAAGDTLTVGGEIIEEIALEGGFVNYRSPPTRMILRARALRSMSA